MPITTLTHNDCKARFVFINKDESFRTNLEELSYIWLVDLETSVTVHYYKDGELKEFTGFRISELGGEDYHVESEEDVLDITISEIERLILTIK
jgi:hypothetical protein